MDAAGGVSAAKNAGVAEKSARPSKADDFKRGIALAMKGQVAPATPSHVGPTAAMQARAPQATNTTTDAARNPASGVLGCYQLTPRVLQDLGWQETREGWTGPRRASRRRLGRRVPFDFGSAGGRHGRVSPPRRGIAQQQQQLAAERKHGCRPGWDAGALDRVGLVPLRIGAAPCWKLRR
jgi:hypothetical protein